MLGHILVYLVVLFYQQLFMNKEKTISNQLSKYYSFELPDRTVQRKENIYWKDIELNYLKEKRHRNQLKLKRRNLILDKQNVKVDLSCEITSVSDNLGTYRSPKSIISTNYLV